MARGRPLLRSVDSDDAGCVTEPREQATREGRQAAFLGRPHPRCRNGLASGPHRGLRAGHVSTDSPGTWETLTSPCEGDPAGDREINPRRGGRAHRPRHTNDGCTRGTDERGRTEATRDGRQGVGVSRSTDEAGEPDPRGPGVGKGSPSMRNHCEDRWKSHRPHQPSQRNCNG